MAKGSETRRRLLDRLDSIEKRIALFASPSPASGQLETRMQEQRSERDRALARLQALDEKIARITSRPEAIDSAIRGSVTRQVESRLASLTETLEARAAAQGEPKEPSLPGRIASRVVHLEKAVAAQHTAIMELRDCSMRAEERMQRVLNSVDTLISTNMRRNSR